MKGQSMFPLFMNVIILFFIVTIVLCHFGIGGCTEETFCSVWGCIK